MGAALLETLLARGEPVTLVTRDSSKAAPWRAKGAQVGPWRVVEPAGLGAHGAVYRALRVGQEHVPPVALKLALFPGDVRFAREVGMLSRSHHPHIPRLFDSGEWEHPNGTRHPFIAMEWITNGAEDVLGRADARTAGWLASHGLSLLRISMGIVFLWFGALKFLPGVSPAQELATRTISVLTFGHMPPSVSLVVLAAWEFLIGIGLIFGLFMRATLLVMLVQIMGTVTPPL